MCLNCSYVLLLLIKFINIVYSVNFSHFQLQLIDSFTRLPSNTSKLSQYIFKSYESLISDHTNIQIIKPSLEKIKGLVNYITLSLCISCKGMFSCFIRIICKYTIHAFYQTNHLMSVGICLTFKVKCMAENLK